LVFPALISQIPDWENPQIVEINRLYPKASFMNYTNRSDAILNDYCKSPYYFCHSMVIGNLTGFPSLLTGLWTFTKKIMMFQNGMISLSRKLELNGYGTPI